MILRPSCLIWFVVLIGLLLELFTAAESMASCTDVVPFSNANPYVDNFKLKNRSFVLQGKSFVIQQAWEERQDDDPEPTGMKWTGAAVWDAAVVLSDFLLANRTLVEGKKVLELGAGLALVSAAVGHCAPEKIVATDYDDHVLTLARNNLLKNLPELSANKRAEVKALGWGVPGDAESLHPPFDVVVGSDVVYREEFFKPLIKTIGWIMSEKSILILAHKNRGLAEDKFFFWLKREFDVVEHFGTSQLSSEFINSGVQVQIFKKK